MNTNRKRKLTLALLMASVPILACGPLFPNRLLDGGDQAVLAAPFARFFKEIERLKITASTKSAVPPTNHLSHADSSFSADLQDLTNALVLAKLSPEKSRETLAIYTKAKDSLRQENTEPPTGADETLEKKKPAPATPPPLPDHLPREFAEYWKASRAWTAKDTNGAVAIWKKILELPAKERHFKSTWATFMLGKATLKSNPALAREYFQQVRTLAKAGFEDTLGLASSSLGWEAKTHYDDGRFLPAMELYLDQAATGDPTAINSLDWTAAKVIALEVAALKPFAFHPRARRVITAWLLQRGTVLDVRGSGNEPALRWLRAVEAADVREVEAAEQLALAAYRCGEVALAKRWLKISRDTPVCQWLQTKFLLMDGKLDDAAALLARVSKFFTLAPYPAGTKGILFFKDSLYFEDNAYETRTAAEEVWGELGTLRLARREYQESLDALLRARFWDDSAFVAERVLTLDELKAFVDRGWPGEVDLNPRGADAHPELKAYATALAKTRDRLKHLLARRLTRNNRGQEARPYFPGKYQNSINTLLSRLDEADDAKQDAKMRAASFMQAARITRKEGLELLGTELAPDFAIYEGNYEGNISPEDRLQTPEESDVKEPPRQVNRVLFSSKDEQKRTAVEPADPPQRFHYRYIAAELGWQGAQLLPDNTDEKAKMLCEAGTWLKYLNPQAADRFYKELVRKCRKTKIGELADAIRWFPLLNEDGELKADQPKIRNTPAPPVEAPAEDEESPDAAAQQ